jgi:hypothetical protein
MKTSNSMIRLPKQTHTPLMVALALCIYTANVSAEKAAVRVPLTPTEALNLGLDPGHDGALFRVVQNSDGALSKGTTLSYSVSAREQRGASNEVILQDTADGRWCELASGNAFADIALNLPSASVITSMRIWGFDQSSSNDLTVSLIERCTPNNQAGGVITSVIAERTSTGNSGNFSQVTAIGANNTVDNDACSYTLRTRYSTPGEPNFCAGSTLRLQKIRFSYLP